MDSYFSNQALNCINDFATLMRSPSYISLRTYNNFLDKYDDIFKLNNKYCNNKYISEKIDYISNKGYVVLEDHNTKWTSKEINRNQSFFDNMFEDVDPNIKLDDEQKKAVVVDEDSSLIIAGAGSGKTTTIAAKVNYLVKIKHIDPKKIAVISFTNKATEELEQRIVDDFNIPVDVTTFHALGMKYIRKITGNIVGIASEFEQRKIIEKYIINEIFQDKEKMDFIVQNFSEYFFNGFKANYKNFNTFNEYFNNYKKRKYVKEKEHINHYIYNRINNALKLEYPISIKGEVCKSIGEVKIANYLFKKGIEYEYERIFPEKVDSDRSYSPDFTIDYHGKNIYIEYFGLSSYYENGTISEKNLKKYKRERNKKLQFFKDKDGIYDLIQLDYYNINDDNEKCYYLGQLKKELVNRGIEFNPKTNEEIFDQLLENNKCAEFFRFVDVIIEAINVIKQESHINDFQQILADWLNANIDENIEYTKYKNQLKILTHFIKYYQTYIINNHLVDYADMINYAYKYINRVYDEKHELDYEYIIIDEYQDISKPRYLLTKKIAEKYKAKVVAVGDDWQSIFAFAGSDVKLFYDFEKLFPGSEKLTINNTYRNSQQLINTASAFILKNPNQIFKSLISNKSLEQPIEIYYYNDENEYSSINELIKSIYNKNPDDEIMILSRRNKDLNALKKSDFFIIGKDDKVICKDAPNAKIIALTVHSAKGLGADQVIILNLSDNVFPSHYSKDYWVIKALRPSENKENFPFAEERRVFYVALTRTKNKVYLLAPFNNRSRFIEEIISDFDVIEKNEYIEA